MTDKLIEQIKTDRERNAIGGGDRRRARTIEYEDRILADAEVIKAAEALAKVLEDGQKVENWSFSAGTEEREGGSGRRQGKELDKVRDWQERRISALTDFRQAQACAEKGGE